MVFTKRNSLFLFLFFQLLFFSFSIKSQTLRVLYNETINNIVPFSWYRADWGVHAINDSVYQWDDYSGNGRHAYQFVPERMPKLMADTINGLPAISFDGVDDFLKLSQRIDTNFVTIYIVARNNEPLFYGSFILGDSATSYKGIYLSKNTMRFIVDGGAGNYTQGSFAESFDYVLGIVNYNSIHANITVNNTYTPASYSLGGNYFGCDNIGYNYNLPLGGSGNLAMMDGEIAEIIVFNRSLNADEQILVETYLRNKYAPPVNLGPDVYLDYGFCGNTTITAGTGYKSYWWSTEAVPSSTMHSITVGPGKYWVQVTDRFNYTSTDTIEVFAPAIAFAAKDTTLCAGDTIYFSLSIPHSSAYTYLWSNGKTDTTIAVFEAGLYAVTITDSLSCSFYSDTVFVNIDYYRDSISLGADTSFCAGNSIALVEGAAQTATYLWSDGTTGNTLTVNSSGDYWVEVTNQRGCKAIDTIHVNIIGVAPLAAFHADTACLGTPTQFNDLSVAVFPEQIVGWLWDFGDGYFSAEKNPQHIYAQAGVYIVSLQVTTDGGCSQQTTAQVLVRDLPQANFSVETTCLGRPYKFTDASIGPDSIMMWNWNFGDGTTSSLQNPSHLYTSDGTFPATLVVYSIYGCSDTITKNVTVVDHLPLPGVPHLHFPANHMQIVDDSITFKWSRASMAEQYVLKINKITGNSWYVYSTNDTILKIYGFNDEGWYYWRVKAINPCGDTIASAWNCFERINLQIIPNISAWYRADWGVHAINDSVYQWDDYSGNGRHAYQFVPERMPKLIADTINGLPAISFDGVDDFLKLSQRIDTNFVTIYIVARNNEPLFYGSFILGDSASSYKGIYFTKNTLRFTVDGIGNYVQGAFGETMDYILGIVNYNSIHANITVNNTYTPASYSLGGNYFGCDNIGYNYNLPLGGSGNLAMMDGEIAEIIVFNRSLNADEQILVETYLRNKYAPPVNLGPDVYLDYGFCPYKVQATGGRFKNYLWNAGSSSSYLMVDTTGVYAVTATDIFGYQSVDSVYVQFPSIPIADTILICAGDSAFINAYMGVGYNYLWSTGTGDSAIYVKTQGNYHVTVSDTLGCQRTKHFYIKVDSFPVMANLGGTDTALCAGSRIRLQTGADEVMNYLWSNGTHQPFMPVFTSGMYAVTVSNFNSCIAKDSIYVRIKGDLPVVQFDAPPVCEGNPTQFHDQSTCSLGSINQWIWKLTPVEVQYTQNPNYIYPAAGSKWVTLIAVTDSGCVDSISKYITVYAKPKAYFLPLSGCQGQEIVFNDKSTSLSGNINQWNWQLELPNNILLFNQPQIAYTFDSVGDYNMQLKVQTQFGCKDSVNKTINIRPSPSVDFSVSGACENQPIAFTNHTSSTPWNDVVVCKWHFGDGDSSALFNPTHYFIAPGDYQVSLWAKTMNGCAASKTKSVRIGAVPLVMFDNSPACSRLTHTFTNNSIASNDTIAQCIWYFNNKDKQIDYNATYAFAQAGVFPVKLVVVTQAGCKDSLTQQIIVRQSPLASFDFSPKQGVVPLQVQFFNNTQFANTYTWNFGDGSPISTQFQPKHLFTSEGIYTIRLKADNNWGCFDTISKKLWLEPIYTDVAIKQINTVALGNFIGLMVDLENKGLSDIYQLELVAHTGNEQQIKEKWEGQLAAGSGMRYTFNAQLGLNSGLLPEYVCVKANIPYLDPDYLPENNLQCKLLKNEVLILEPYPNPATDVVSLGIISPQPEQINIQLINALGELVQQIFDGITVPNLNVFSINLKNYSNGLYVIRVQYKDQQYIYKIIKR